jgi:Tfp pilus assembly protein PilN
MKTDSQIQEEVKRIDDNINNTKAAMNFTDATINQLTRLNDRRRAYLRELGQKRSELMTFELL